MLTPLGKAFTFFMVVLSVLALGLAMWVAADPVQIPNDKGAMAPSFQAKWDALDNQIRTLETNKKREMDGLGDVAAKMGPGLNDLPAPFNPADPLGLGKATTVAQLQQDIKKGEADLNTLLNTWTAREADLARLINDLDVTRTQVRAALAEQKRLAEVIVPDPAKEPGKVPFREQTSASYAAKGQSEKRQDDLKPILVNETLRLMGLMKRNEILEKRAGELGGN